MRYLLDDLRDFRFQCRPVDNCTPGRGGISQDGGTRSGTFHGEIDRCRESWTTACSSMPERDGKGQGENSPKQARSCWFAPYSWPVTSGTNLYPPEFCFADTILPFYGVTFFFLYFVLLFFVIIIFPSIEATALRSILLRYACAPAVTRYNLGTNNCLCPL